MDIVYICKQPLNTIWYDAKTFLLVFDENNKQVADYDFSSGLKLMKDDKNIIVFIHNKNLIPGKWNFLGTKLVTKNNKLIEEKIYSSGFKEGTTTTKKYNEKNVFDISQTGTINNIVNEQVSVKEREKRIKICRNCPFFVNENGTCSINGNLVIQTTKLKYEYCPEEKWGDKEKSIQHNISLLQRQGTPDDIISSGPAVVTIEEQKEFEDEFEQYLKGL